MYTIYLLKNCSKSLSTLLKLFKKADIKTNIVIVDNYYAKILNSDKRVKQIPFVIDKIPTKKGLIPKNARIISMNTFIKNNCKPKKKPKKKAKPKPRPGSNSIGRVITYNPKSIPTKSIPKKIIPKRPIRKPVVKMPIKRPVKKPIIKTIKRKDKSIDIILSAN
jgi:hypothetical protein